MTPSPLLPTSRPSTAPEVDSAPHAAADDGTTPTRATFNGSTTGQKPLPTTSFPHAVQIPSSSDHAKSDSPHHTPESQRRDSMDMDLDESDGENGAHGDAGSDDESVSGDGTSSKKKKSQRFYCTEFPPCNLSFTRSEHLARHIRYAFAFKHSPRAPH